MRCPASCDQEHPVVYMIGDCDIPDRGTAIFGKGESPLPKLKADLLQLCDMGADVLAVPCNTAHFFIDQFADELPVPLLHIVDETVKAAKELSPERVPGCCPPKAHALADCIRNMPKSAD